MFLYSSQIQKDDGYPVNICKNCLDKLNLIKNFKEMVLKSEIKLDNFYRSKMMKFEKKIQDNLIEVVIKEEDALILNNDRSSKAIV